MGTSLLIADGRLQDKTEAEAREDGVPRLFEVVQIGSGSCKVCVTATARRNHRLQVPEAANGRQPDVSRILLQRDGLRITHAQGQKRFGIPTAFSFRIPNKHLNSDCI